MKNIIKILEKIKSKPKTVNFTPKIPYLQEDIEKQRIKEIVASNLDIIEKEVKYIFLKIKICSTIEEANFYFNILQEIVDVLQGPIYINDMIVTPAIAKFIKDFDRLDMECIRNYFFPKIKDGTYSI
jgi:hypothetical protein